MRIVAILIDRLPATSLGCYGSWQNPTPQLDSAASRSLTCTNFYHFDPSQDVLPADVCEVIAVTPESLIETVDMDLLMQASETWLGDRPEGMEIDDLAEAWQLYVEQPHVLAVRSVPERLALHAVWVRAFDRWFGEQFLNWQELLQPDDLLLISASRGESLAVRELGLDRQRPLQPALQHLPLILALPGSPQRPCRLHAPLGPADLHSLLKRLDGADQKTESVLNSWCAELESRNSLETRCESHSVRLTAEWTCIHPSANSEAAVDDVALFHRPEDRWGLLNVASQYPHIAQEFLDDVS